MKRAEEVIHQSLEQFGRKLVVSTSFQKGGMVILDMAVKLDPSVRIITLDTGRLPEGTHKMIEVVRDRYGVQIEVLYPDAVELAGMVERHGPNLFYRDVAFRRLCCEVRKVRPWNRRLFGVEAVMTGLRRDQSESRENVEQVDSSDVPVKINPLAYWSERDVEGYTELHRLPVHPLYEVGYRSIGCAPCTRATADGADVRSGRWWWENDSDKECGIHVSPEGLVRRKLDVLLSEILNPKGQTDE